MFLFRLALALGRRVRDLETWGASELGEWMAFYDLHPFGDDREDLRAAAGFGAVVNMLRGKGQRAIRGADFMPALGVFAPAPDADGVTPATVRSGPAPATVENVNAVMAVFEGMGLAKRIPRE